MSATCPFFALVDGPPQLEHVNLDGSREVEPQLLVGWVAAGPEARDSLSHYGLDLRLAWHEASSGRWLGCLFSVAVADLLETLSRLHQLSFDFEARPSRGELLWAQLHRAGLTERPRLERWLYLTSATDEELRLAGELGEELHVRSGSRKD